MRKEAHKSNLPKVISHKVNGRGLIFTSALSDSKVGAVFPPFWSAGAGKGDDSNNGEFLFFGGAAPKAHGGSQARG